MPQVLKAEVRERIVAAALEVFAEQGFERATMATIAARAGLGTASLYRYFAAKEQLFAAAVPETVVSEFRVLIKSRVRALAAAHAGDPDTTAEAMLASSGSVEQLQALRDGRCDIGFMPKAAAKAASQRERPLLIEALPSDPLAAIFKNTRTWRSSIHLLQ